MTRPGLGAGPSEKFKWFLAKSGCQLLMADPKKYLTCTVGARKKCMPGKSSCHLYVGASQKWLQANYGCQPKFVSVIVVFQEKVEEGQR